MRFRQLRLRDMGPFSGEHVVDFEAFDGKIVAVVGDNGAGKSTLLELLAGALYRACPTRGKLATLATSRSSYVEVAVEDGALYTVRQIVDALGKSEALVLDAHGAPLTETAKVRDYDAWALAHLTPASVLYASSFSAQGKRGLLDLSASERKAVVLRLLGCERLEQLAGLAREQARAAHEQVSMLRGRIADIHVPDADGLAARASETAEALERARSATVEARRVLAQASASATDAGRRDDMRAARRAVEQQHTRAVDSMVALRGRHLDLLGALADADKVRAASERVPELREQVERAAHRRAQAQQVAEAAVRAARERTAELERGRAKAFALDTRIAKISARLADAEAIERAAAELPHAEQTVAAALRNEAALDEKAQRTNERIASGEGLRVSSLRWPLLSIAGGAPEAQSVATQAIETDDALALENARAPADLAEARAHLERARAATQVERMALARQAALAARASDMQTARADLAAAQQERAEETERLDSGASTVQPLNDAAEEARRDCATIADATMVLADELRGIERLAARAPEIAAAHARLSATLEQIAEARAEYARTESALAATPAIDDAEQVDLAGPRARLADAERLERDCIEAATRAQLAVERAADDGRKRGKLARELVAASDSAADWQRLGADLGRDGLQAMEIDAAVPEINALANDLLHTCHGSRFTVEVRTTRESSDGKRTLEGLDVRVLDTVGGRDDVAETYSGGECVIDGEALALALTVVACRRRGAERPTLIRDESGSALDAENARAYVAMLRRAAAQVGAACTLIVSHDSAVQQLADARIDVTPSGLVVSL